MTTKSINDDSRTVIDEFRVMFQLVASLTIVARHLLSSLTIVIYDRNVFIAEATEVEREKKKRPER